MKLQELIIEFLRENGLYPTERYLEDRPNNRKLIRFVKGNSKYSLVFSNGDPNLHLFKEKLWDKTPYPKVATTHGGPKGKTRNYKRSKIVVDINNKESFKKILDFL